MKAILVHEFGGPECMIQDEIDDPTPSAGEILVKIEAAGVNPVDTYIRSGVYAHLPDLPYIPGGDGAGVVEALGSGVTGFAVGQRVYIARIVGARLSGCYAERIAAPAVEVFALPENTSYAAGATMGVPCATAYHGLSRGRWAPGETLFVHGASGAVGLTAVQLARAHGMRVIGSAGSDSGRALVAQCGAHAVVDHTAAGYMDEVAALTEGQGPDLILEMLANVNLQADLESAARFGRIVVIGNRGEIQINARLAMMKELDVMGIALWNCSPPRLRAIHQALIAALEAGTLAPPLSREIPLAEAPSAHVAVMEPGARGKIVLVP